MSNFSSFAGYAGPITAYGSSYMADPAISADARGGEMYRQVAQRGGIASVTSYGVSGSRLIEIAARMVGPVPDGSNYPYPAADAAGRIVLIDGATNDAQFSAGSGSTPTTEESSAAMEALRTICAIAGTRERIADTDARWNFAGANWGAATGQNYASAGTYHYNAGSGAASCTCTWTQPAGVGYMYFLGLGASASSTSYVPSNVSFSVDGAAATSKNFRGTVNAFSSQASGWNNNQAIALPVVYRIAVPVNATPTQHTLTVSKNDAYILAVNALLIPAVNPPRVTLLKSPPIPTANPAGAKINALLPTFNGYVDTVAAEFLYAHAVDWQGSVNGAYNAATMISTADNIHPNLAGETHVADQVVADINGLPPVITSAASVTFTKGTPATFQLTASGNPTSWAATGLPAGCTLNVGTGLISYDGT